MTEFTDVLERVRGRIPPPDVPIEAVLRRRDRRRRNRRVATGALAVLIALLAVGGVIRLLTPFDRGRPAQQPISPETVGSLELRWSAELRGLPSAQRNRFTSREPLPPTVANGTVYVGTQTGRLYAFPTECGMSAATCTPTWYADTSVPPRPSMGSHSQRIWDWRNRRILWSPTVADGLVLVTTAANDIYAYPIGCASAARACRPAWVAHPGRAMSAPVVSAGMAYVIDITDARLHALCLVPGDGCRSWTVRLGAPDPKGTQGFGQEIVNEPVVAGGVVYAMSPIERRLWAIDARTGRPLWFGDPGPIASGVRFNSPVVSGDTVVFEAGAKVYAFAVGCAVRGRACEPMWRSGDLGAFAGQPVVSSGVVFVPTAQDRATGSMVAFDPHCGQGGVACKPLWTSEVFGELTVDQPVAADGAVYAASNLNELVARFPCETGPAGCRPSWVASGPYEPLSPVVSNGVVYVSSTTAQVEAFPASCDSPCKPLWTWSNKAEDDSPPAVADGAIFMATTQGRLLSFAPGTPAQSGRTRSSDRWTALFYLALALFLALVFARRHRRRSS